MNVQTAAAHQRGGVPLLATPGLLRLVCCGVLSILVVVLAAAAAVADPARGTSLACPNETADAFADDNGNAHEGAIDCMARWEVVAGASPTAYQPQRVVRRDQAASFIVRLLSTAGFRFDDAPADSFDDDNGNTHERSINRLAAAGVARGGTDHGDADGDGDTSERLYRPSELVSRGQMAALLTRAMEALEQHVNAEHEHFSDDDRSPFERDIDALASAGIAVGDAAGRYQPGLGTRRAPMATLLARAADYLAEQGSWPTATGPVAAPTDFTATPRDGGEILLTWTPAEDIRVDVYFLQIAAVPPGVSCESPRFQGFAEVVKNRTTDTYVHHGEPGVTYCYRLRAVDQTEDGTQQRSPGVFAGPATAR